MARDRRVEYDKRNAKRRSVTRDRLNRQVDATIEQKAGPKFSLYKKIKESPYYGKRGNDERARAYLTENLGQDNSSKILPGQLIMFDYFEPIHKEELEWYDAGPCTIFFSVVDSKNGKRVLGFNIHYYPPQIRYKILSMIMDIFKPFYSKYFTDTNKVELDGIAYKYLIESLEKAKLSFGVRMYDPKLIKRVYKIPPQYWQVAVFTEGWFKKRTREAIFKYWKEMKSRNV